MRYLDAERPVRSHQARTRGASIATSGVFAMNADAAIDG
jgi:hypothetical protein